MANTYKNIIVFPNRSSDTQNPNIEFRGANSGSNLTISMTMLPDSNGTLAFTGSSGQLFSVSNDLTGTLFSVNDISGVPSLEVDANGAIHLAQYSGSVGIGASNTNYKLTVQDPYVRITLRSTGNGNNAGYRVETLNATGSYCATGVYGIPTAPITDRYIGLSGDDTTIGFLVSANNQVQVADAASLYFGATTRQMVNLWQTVYGIGVQSSTQYYRSGGNFAWYYGGSHDNNELNPGGGTTLMTANSTALALSIPLGIGSTANLIRTNDSGSYSAFKLTGSKGSYGGIYDGYSAVNMMWDSSGNGGEYRSAWRTYWSVTNACMGIDGSTTSSSYSLYVSGAIYATGDIVAYSDARLKENVYTIENPLSKVMRLRGVNFNRIDDPEKKLQMGVIAQEVLEVVPEVVTHSEKSDADGNKGEEYGVNYGALVGVLIEAIKELNAKVDAQEKRIEELEGKNNG